MSNSREQLSSLTEAVSHLIDAYTALKESNSKLLLKLDAAEKALTEERHKSSTVNNQSTHSSQSQGLTAADMDALVEEIDSCIALLKK